MLHAQFNKTTPVALSLVVARSAPARKLIFSAQPRANAGLQIQAHNISAHDN